MATPEGVHATSAVPSSGDNSIDSLLDGQKWDGAVGTAASLTFSFAKANSVWSASYTGEPSHSGYGAFPADGADAVRDILQQISEIANLRFREISETNTSVGDLRFGMSGSEPAPAWAYTPGGTPMAGDVWFNSGYPLSEGVFDPGMGGYYTLLHEIGHALGFKHSFEGSPVLPGAKNNHFYSVMTYAPSEYGSPATLMLYDILALQYLYGANMTTRTGDDVYMLDQYEHLSAIWDAAGEDTVSAAKVEANALIPRVTTIDLNPGEVSEFPIYYTDGNTTSVEFGYLTIAYNVVIENAIGSEGKDVLVGNAQANSLQGRPGNDELLGAGGRDSLDGGAAKDTLDGANSADTLLGGGDNDRLNGGNGKDTLTGGTGKDKFEFDTALNATSNVDRIADFLPVDDTIELDKTIFTKLATGTLASNAFYAGNAAHDTSDRIVYNTGTGNLYYDSDGTGSASAVLFATLSGTPSLTAADFLIVA